MASVIDTTAICKTFTASHSKRSVVPALSNVSFTLHTGEFLVVLGPSGAGKTTLARIVMSHLTPTSGRILRFGMDTVPREWEAWTGYVPESGTMSARATGRRVLAAAGQVPAKTTAELSYAVDSMLDAFGLASLADTPSWTYSRGVAARLSVACALIHRPRLVVLDNPTQSLDHTGRILLKRALEHLRMQGASVLLTSCEITDVESCADTILVLRHGNIANRGKLCEVLSPETAFTVKVSRDPLLAPGWQFVRNGEGWYSLVSGRSQLDLLLRALTCRGITPSAVAPVPCATTSLF